METLHPSHDAKSHPAHQRCDVFEHSPFEYQPLESQAMIRLIKVHPDRVDGLLSVSMGHVHLPQQPTTELSVNVPSYRCLSYTWGEPSGGHRILVNGMMLQVRKNLFEFLELARDSYPDEPMWIDALCIDQGDHTEKNHQVQRMGYIYTQAREVLVWLGKDLNTSYLSDWMSWNPKTYMRYIGFSLPAYEVPTFDFRTGRWPSNEPLPVVTGIPKNYASQLHEVCCHDYWSRAWIAQEILLQSNVTILIGRERIDWEVFSHVLREPETWEPQTWNGKWQNNPARLLTMAWTERQPFPGVRANYNFWELLEKRSASRCFNIRDRIYSLLALEGSTTRSGSGLFVVDYGEDIVNLFWRAGQHYNAWSSPKYVAILMNALDLRISHLEEATKMNPDQRIRLSRAQVVMIPRVKRFLEQNFSDPEDLYPDQHIILPVIHMINYMKSMRIEAYQGLVLTQVFSSQGFWVPDVI